MADYLNPRGTVIPQPGRFDLPAGSVIVFGTPGADDFTFTYSYPRVVIGLGGGDDFYADANNAPLGTKRYYSYLREKEWVEDGLGGGRRWEPWKSGNDEGYGSGGTDWKLGIGADHVTAIGKNYSAPLRMWVQPDDRMHLAGEEDVIRFRTGAAQPDSDGRGYTAPMVSLTVEGNAGRVVEFIFSDQGTYFDRPGHSIYRQSWVDFANRSGPTEAEVQTFADGLGTGNANWDVLV